MNKTILVTTIFVLLSATIINAIPTGVDLSDDVWKGGYWQRRVVDKDMQTRLIERFGGKTHLQVIQELYIAPPNQTLKMFFRKINASIQVIGGRVQFEVYGQDDCKTQGLQYCESYENVKNKQKCVRNTLARCGMLQAFYD